MCFKNVFFVTGPHLALSAFSWTPSTRKYQLETTTKSPYSLAEALLEGPCTNHILIPRAHPEVVLLFWCQMKAHIFLIITPKFQS